MWGTSGVGGGGDDNLEWRVTWALDFSFFFFSHLREVMGCIEEKGGGVAQPSNARMGWTLRLAP